MNRLTPLRSVSALGGAAACFLAAQIASAEPFTIAVMPDTQSEATNTPQVKFPALTQWIADNKTPRSVHGGAVGVFFFTASRNFLLHCIARYEQRDRTLLSYTSHRCFEKSTCPDLTNHNACAI